MNQKVSVQDKALDATMKSKRLPISELLSHKHNNRSSNNSTPRITNVQLIQINKLKPMSQAGTKNDATARLLEPVA